MESSQNKPKMPSKFLDIFSAHPKNGVKGRSNTTDEFISSESEQVLKQFYNQSLSEEFEKRIGRNFTWRLKYN